MEPVQDQLIDLVKVFIVLDRYLDCIVSVLVLCKKSQILLQYSLDLVLILFELGDGLFHHREWIRLCAQVHEIAHQPLIDLIQILFTVLLTVAPIII